MFPNTMAPSSIVVTKLCDAARLLLRTEWRGLLSSQFQKFSSACLNSTTAFNAARTLSSETSGTRG